MGRARTKFCLYSHELAMSKQLIAITTGDHRGIGPEVISKGLWLLRKQKITNRIVVFGLPELYKPFCNLLPKNWFVFKEDEVFKKPWVGIKQNHLNFVVPQYKHLPKTKQAAFLSGRYVELAALGALKNNFSAITTGPIDKTELRRGGFAFNGHTEMLKSLCKARSATMMFVSKNMCIALVSVHIGISGLTRHITQERIKHCLLNTCRGLKELFGIKKPRIAVLGLNPHASEQGLLGNEEQTKISPAIAWANKNLIGCHATGPHPADGFFGQWLTRYKQQYDAIVCMYHDQGLIPVKLLDFESAVNLTLGLPIIRTSVDHGIGLDIAGKNKANPNSFISALKLALKLAHKRTKRA